MESTTEKESLSSPPSPLVCPEILIRRSMDSRRRRSTNAPSERQHERNERRENSRGTEGEKKEKEIAGAAKGAQKNV